MSPSGEAQVPRLRGSEQTVRRSLVWAVALVALIGLAFVLAWVSSRFQNVDAWFSFTIILLLAGGLLLGGWRLVREESPPRWLGALMLGAALLRLAVGIFWYISLPVWGYGSPAETGGYVMSDAYERDRSAWELAQSEKPLVKAFQGGYRRYDQYGGLLFMSAALYRYLAGEAHPPLMIVTLTAAFSSLAILFTWAMTRRAWNAEAAAISAWLLVFYPEAVLISSSQMREAFTITLVAAAFYGLVRYLRDQSGSSLLWVLISLLLCLPFSPPFAALLLIMLFVVSIAAGRGTLWRQLVEQRRALVILGLLLVMVVAGLWLTWGSFAPEGVSNPYELVSWWVKKSADWQAYLSERASGWVQKIFDSTPEEMHTPLLLAYGVVQPFLPAALSDTTGAVLWRAVAVWRAVGWTLLLVLLLYAPLRALRRIDAGAKDGMRDIRLVLAFSLVVWLGILIASYRGGGDQWDNPRYREAFAGLQVALAAWALAAQRQRRDPWLRRAVVGAVLILVWFMPWYLRRYIYLPWDVVDLFKILGLGVATAVLYWIWDWAGSNQEASS
ncbi:MAG: hypothetical protein ACWGO1_03295 [Anaerolineales bacterium]